MDGFEKDTDIIVLAATNRLDSLDPALLRPSRFDKIIQIPLPNLEARKDIFNYYLNKISCDNN